MEKMTGLIAVCLITLIASEVWSGDTPDAEDLAYKSYEAVYFPGKDARWRAELVITDRRDRTRSRTITMLRRNSDDYRQAYYAYFHEPPDLRRMVFLVRTRPGDDDDRWLYLPEIDLEQRITGPQKRNAFAGSDFTYEDMTGRYPGEDHFEFLREDTVDDRPVWVLKGTPRDPGMVEFAHFEMFIDRETFLVLRGMFFDDRGDLQRTLSIEKWEEIQGYFTPVLMKAENHRSGSTSLATMSLIEYDLDIPERSFDQRFLRRPPTPWIQP
jgi:hypothetical protein